MTTEEEFEEWWNSKPHEWQIYYSGFKFLGLDAYLKGRNHQQQKIDRLKEGINAALSYTLPYLAEKVLREVLEESK